MSRTILILCAASLVCQFASGQTREEKVRRDRAKVTADGFWIYNDLAGGFAEAKQSGRPLMVVLRCIPCEDCVKLDDDLVDKHPRLRPLLEKFVRVRQVATNGLDLSIFQFDTDQSFAVFLLNGDGAIYGRFGTRSDHSHWTDDVSIEGLAKALEGALELHAQYPRNQQPLAAKKGPPPEFAVPEDFPVYKSKYGPKLNYEGNVVASCIHCHQIGDAQRQWYRENETVIPEKLLFSYPHPKAIGLILDPQERATVVRAEKGSIASHAGFMPGDVLLTLAGQPLLSMADVQWVLHHTPPEGGSVTADVKRGNESIKLDIVLPAGWRQLDDIAWRASSWELRRSGLGGLYLKNVTPEELANLKLKESHMALKVVHVGEYAPHDRAKKAGFQKGDVVISFNQRTDLRRETDLLAYALNQVPPNTEVPVTVLRDGKRMTLQLPVER